MCTNIFSYGAIQRKMTCLYRLTSPTVRNFFASSKYFGLDEFFDETKNWGLSNIHSGRPWRIEELRLKGNVDLHKLWYILLKERNMLMTMEEEHNRCLERMPNAERLEKVEESMENLLSVVTERNRAEAELEIGEVVGPKLCREVDILGREVTALTREHVLPKVAGKQETESMWSDETTYLLREMRARQIQRLRERHRKLRYKNKIDEYAKRDNLSD